MIISTMKNRLKKCLFFALKYLLPIAFWCAIWQLFALRVNNMFILPDIKHTFIALKELLLSAKSYKIIGNSIIRVLSGLLLGTTLGIVLAVVSCKIKGIYYILSPLMSVIKSTPVASFILILWIYFSGNGLPVIVGVLMVLPIVWQNVLDGYASIDKDLLEVATVFEFSYKKKLTLLFVPAIRKYLTPAIITASGLAWKAEIAAEIIGYTKKSIGQYINDAKYDHNTATVFAWSLIVILLSVILEKITKLLLRRSKQ